MKEKLKNLWPLLVITLLGAVLRLYRFPDAPPSLNWDEVSHGYNAYSILKTGADEWGIRLPLIFRAFGDYKLPLYIYLTIIPVWFFGLTAFSVRLISVLAGILAIPGIYFLANELFNGRRSDLERSFSGPPPQRGRSDLIGLISSFLLALSPWHFFISRPALEANLALTLFIFGLYFLLKSLHNTYYLLLATGFLTLTLHTYNSYRVITPLLLLGFFIIFRPKYKFNATIVTSFFVILAGIALVAYQVLSGTGSARYQKLAILSEYNVFQIGQQRLASPLPPVLARLVHNRPVYFISQVALNYSSYFSPIFLYQAAGSQYQFAIPGKNLLTLPVTLLVLFGFYHALRHRRQPAHRFTILLLLLGPLAASLTADPPQALRPTPMIPTLILLAALGFASLYELGRAYFQRRSWSLLPYLLLVLAFASGRYLSAYFTRYQSDYSPSWQYGHQQVFDYLKEHRFEYQRIFITKEFGEPHIFYAFYNQLDPRVLQPGGDSLRFFQSDWYWTDRIQNVYFVNAWDIPGEKITSLKLESGASIATANSLLVTTPFRLPLNAKPVKTIDFLDGQLAFVIAKF